jgi:tetratricopeptide (TPR) repeat protein
VATEKGRPEEPRRAWSPGGIAIVTVLLSPLPGGILHALNYARLGLPERRRRALVTNLCGAAAFAVVAYLVPLWSLLLTFAFAAYFQGSQSGLFESHLARGGRKANLLLPALGWFLCTVGPLALLAEAIDRWVIVDRFDQGLAMIKERRFDEAEAIFRDYLRAEPMNPWPRWNLAVIEECRDRPDAASVHIRVLLRDHPGFDGAEEYLGELEQRARFARGYEALLADRLDEAGRAFLECLRHAPRARDARWNLAIVYERQGHVGKAIEEVEKLLAEHPGDEEIVEHLEYLKQLPR